MILVNRVRRLRWLGKDECGQDLLEYALMAAFVAVVIGAILPSSWTPALSTIMSKIKSVATLAAS